MRRFWTRYRTLRRAWQVTIAATVTLVALGAIGAATEPPPTTAKAGAGDVADQLPFATTSTTAERTTTTVAPTTVPSSTTTTVAPTTTTAPPVPAPSCDPHYGGGCVPIASDVDCAGGSGNGPAYVAGPVTVVGTDIYGLDSDHDGVGCEG